MNITIVEYPIAGSIPMQSYKSIIATSTPLVQSTDSDMFKFLKGMHPESMTQARR